MAEARLIVGECIESMREMQEASIDAIVTDPPYGLGFMGKQWDALPPGIDWAAECLRVLKPGGHLLAFGGTRTWHRLACAIEDAGFEIRDSIAWLYGSGFPKSLDVSKAIDKAAGAEREVIGSDRVPVDHSFAGPTYGGDSRSIVVDITAPATSEAKKWQGWGTALKPAFEPIVVARKPLIGTVAQNVLEHGTGALNIAATRLAYQDDEVNFDVAQRQQHSKGSIKGAFGAEALIGKEIATYKPEGRWPANVTLTHNPDCKQINEHDELVGRTVESTVWTCSDECVVADLDAQSGITTSASGASRFFYVSKASKRERPAIDGVMHPTVKPLDLMRWLVRLVTPPGGTVLDPFAGSGTTLEAALLEGFDCIGVEITQEYVPLIEARIARAHEQRATKQTAAEPTLFDE